MKDVPRGAARKLTAISFQLSAFERHEIVAACKEYGGTVIQNFLVAPWCARLKSIAGGASSLLVAHGGQPGMWDMLVQAGKGCPARRAMGTPSRLRFLNESTARWVDPGDLSLCTGLSSS
jgi:hypothetical protein